MDRIKQLLKTREENSLLRILHPASKRANGKITIKGCEYLDFSSNDYLGLSDHPRILQAATEALEKFGLGASASRLLSGDLEIHHQLEEKTAQFKDKEAALIFNSGYQANIGIIGSLCQKEDVIFSDKLNHASIIDGVILSGARFFRFNHNNVEHLETLLKKERSKFKQALIITETIFSMDGDRCPLKDLIKLKEKYNCYLYVDEAHASGIFGKNGAGVAQEEGLSGRIDLIMGTFSKALGSFGGYLACSKKTKDYLINFARSFIYSTALPACIIAANLASLKLVQDEPERRRKLLEKADCFRQALKKQGLKVKGSSQIIPWVVGENQKAVDLSDKLKKRGYWTLPIRTPTVAASEARIRFSLSYAHSQVVLKKLADDINQINV